MYESLLSYIQLRQSSLQPEELQKTATTKHKPNLLDKEDSPVLANSIGPLARQIKPFNVLPSGHQSLPLQMPPKKGDGEAVSLLS